MKSMTVSLIRFSYTLGIFICPACSDSQGAMVTRPSHSSSCGSRSRRSWASNPKRLSLVLVRIPARTAAKRNPLASSTASSRLGLCRFPLASGIPSDNAYHCLKYA